MQKKIHFTILLILYAIVLLGQDASWKVSKYKANFTIKNAGIKIDGGFLELDAHIVFDEKSASNYFKASVNTKTIKTGIDARDNHLKKESYFNVEKFPIITIESSKITALGNGKYIANCLLKIKGISKPFLMPFTYKNVNGNGLFNSTFNINRLDFNVGESSCLLADDVLVHIEIEAKKN